MGSSESYKVNKGVPIINLILEKYDFFPGEPIKGHIFLQSFNFLKNGSVVYQLFNEEYYSYKDSKNFKFNTTFSKFVTYNELIDYSLSAGKKIPFSILSKNNNFPSFEYSLAKVNGYIRNYIKIIIPELNLFKKQLIVIKKPFILYKSLLSFNKVENLNLIGIFNKGNISFNVSYKKNSYEFFDKIPIKIIINNNSNNKIDILNIKKIFLRNIIFKNTNNNKNITITDIILNNEMNIDKKLDKNLEIDTYVDIEETESLFNKYKVDIYMFNFLNIQDKSNLIKLLPDIDSNLIKCEYKIQLIFTYNYISNKEVSLEMPIYIYHEQNEINSQLNKENILNKNNIDILIRDDEDLKQIKNGNKIENNNIKIKEPHIFTNNEKDDWNTPTNGALIPRVE